MTAANTLAYYVKATITTIKSFIVQAPGLKSHGKKFVSRFRELLLKGKAQYN